MCGIAGIVRLDAQAPSIEVRTLEIMRDRLRHRGPDDSGIYHDEFVGLVSTRLSILDLTRRGRMPMTDPARSCWIVHNGEIYNYAEIREELEKRGFRFHTRTDTEVLLKGFLAYGVQLLEKTNGMFAFAIWDAKNRRFFAARDRFGIKPLYYTVQNQIFYFASEPKALLAAGIPAEFNESQCLELLCFRYVTGTLTPYRNIFRLLPGQYLLIADGKITVSTYYDHFAVVSQQINQRKKGNQDGRNNERFLEILTSSVTYRMVSDVPLGVMLSGGLDSSSIAAVLAQKSGESIHSFTIRFRQKPYDEGPFARDVVKRWGLTSHEIYFNEDEIPALLVQSTWYLDEPLVHVNDIGIWKIARHARDYVKVLLSGEGADETLSGYVRYRFFRYPWITSCLPHPVMSMNKFLRSRRFEKVLKLMRFPSLKERILWSQAELFPEDIGIDRKGFDTESLKYRWSLINCIYPVGEHPIHHVLFYDQNTYLQSVLDRNDRMTMGASIECRVPFLDHRLVEYLWSVSPSDFYNGFKGKRILRESMKPYLPRRVLSHKKWGFGIPLDQYMRRNPILRKWLEDMITSNLPDMIRLKRDEIENKVKGFLNGDHMSYPSVRQFLLLYIWKQLYIDRVWNPESFT